jgi:hypothetical protein
MRRSAVGVVTVLAVIGLVASGCADPEAPGPPAGAGLDPEAAADGVVPLAKAEGWREQLQPMGTPFAVLEIADDRDTAERAWRDNVPDDLPPGEGVPDEPGVYGALEQVDFERQALVVWSSGESGTCPAWLFDVRARDDGAVDIEQRDITSLVEEDVMCTMDYRPYRMVLAVDRDRLPDLTGLPTEDVHGVPDGRVSAYPDE